MCTITQHFNHCWTMNLESSESVGVSGRFDKSDASIDSQDFSQRSNSLQPEQLPKGYTPRSVDVCCGRGKKNWRHQGNSSFRKLIHSNVAAYIDAATKHDKTRLVKSIVEMVRSNGGRFLKQSNDGYWYDIGDSQAREKVGHSLRDQVTALSKQKKDPPSASTPKPRRSPSVSSSVYSPLPHRLSLPASPYPAYPARSAEYEDATTPLNEVGELPSDLAGILSHIHFPSIQSPAPNQLESSSSSFTPSSYQSMHASSQSLGGVEQHRRFNSSVSSGLVNFFEPLDEAMEPTPIMEESGHLEPITSLWPPQGTEDAQRYQHHQQQERHQQQQHQYPQYHRSQQDHHPHHQHSF